MILMIDSGKISSSAAKLVFRLMYEKGYEPTVVVEELKLEQVSDEGAIMQVIEEVLKANEKVVADYKSGNQKVFGFLVGSVMKELKGKGNPGLINDLLKKKLTD
jgi:aspartyl-tRNA(Asn)/glutamyl-tRNA(Gln) amidotransferase subunit B